MKSLNGSVENHTKGIYNVMKHLRVCFLNKTPFNMLVAEQIRKTKNGSFFGSVQYDIEVPEETPETCAEVPFMFKSTVFGNINIELKLKIYAEKEGC